MSSLWRQSAAPQTQDDMDGLISLALAHATELLRDGSRLAPFAAAVPLDGRARVLSPVPAQREQRAGARAQLAAMYADARRDVGRYRAVAFTAEITYGGGRAVRVEAEHRDGIALAVRVPFRPSFFGGVRLGTMQLDPGPARLWP
jgi:hypothetical protein